MTCVIPRFVRDEVVKAIDPDSTGWSGTDGPGVASYVETDGSRRMDIFVGLQFDGYKRYQNISDEFPNMEFKFPPPPTVTCPSDVIDVDPDEDTVISIEVGDNNIIVKKLDSLKRFVRTTVAASHN